MNGFVLVDKPAGMSSHQVTHVVRRALGAPGGRRGLKIGHAGTLDPFATGLVVVLLGRATRLMPFVVGCDKRYLLTARLGYVSTTDDRMGDVTATAAAVAGALPDEDAIRTAVQAIAARTEQVPPAVSALHIDGVRAYERVRRGETVTVAPRHVRIDSADVVDIGAPETDEHGVHSRVVTVDVSCGSGTYLRSVARDLGEELGGVGGIADELRRTRVGDFDVADARLPDTVRTGDIRPMHELLASVPRITVDVANARELAHGRAIEAAVTERGSSIGVLCDGELVAMVSAEQDDADRHVMLQPHTVFIRPEELVTEVQHQ